MTEETRPPRLPFAAEFSPGVVELRVVLSIVDDRKGDKEGIEEGIRNQYFLGHASDKSDPAEREKQQRTLAYNTLLGMANYGLVDRDGWRLTDIGRLLLDSPSDEEMNKALATHILLECYGLDVLDATRALQARGERVTKNSLHRQLETMGFELPANTTHHTKLLQWLREDELLSGYSINEKRLAVLVGDLSDLRAEWATMPGHQRAFVETLKRLTLTGETSFPTKTVKDETLAEHGDGVFPRPDQLRADVTQPLEEAGWIEVEFASEGRGGKSGTLTVTEKLQNADLDLIADAVRSLIPHDIQERLNTPIDRVLKDLESTDTHIKGVALEVLACRIAIDLGLLPVQFRLRSSRTGGAEVDLTAEGVHLHHSRWLFQCKNTPASHVPLSALAKEVGMAVMLKAHVVVLVTTGDFASSVVVYARQLMQDSHLQVVLVDRSALAEYRERGKRALQRYFRKTAQEVFRLKRQQMEEDAPGADVDA